MLPLTSNILQIKALNFIMFFINFVSAESSYFSSKPSTNQLIIVTPEILFTIPHEGNIIRFECSKNNDVVSWIFPNDDEIRIPVNSTSTVMEDNFNLTTVSFTINLFESSVSVGTVPLLPRESPLYTVFLPIGKKCIPFFS